MFFFDSITLDTESYVHDVGDILDSSSLISRSAIVIDTDNTVRPFSRILTVISIGIRLNQDSISYCVLM